MSRKSAAPGSSILRESDVHKIAYKMKQDFDLCKRYLQLYLALQLCLADTIGIPEDRYTFFIFMLTKWIAECTSECPPTVGKLVDALRDLQMNSVADSMLALERDGEIGANPSLGPNSQILTPPELPRGSNPERVNVNHSNSNQNRPLVNLPNASVSHVPTFTSFVNTRSTLTGIDGLNLIRVNGRYLGSELTGTRAWIGDKQEVDVPAENGGGLWHVTTQQFIETDGVKKCFATAAFAEEYDEMISDVEPGQAIIDILRKVGAWS